MPKPSGNFEERVGKEVNSALRSVRMGFRFSVLIILELTKF